jgi:hypothetical protein
MKKLFHLLFILSLLSCVTTKPIMLSYEDYTAEKEIQSNRSKNDLFTMANSWMVEKFISSTDVIQYSDKEAGIIKGRFLLAGSLKDIWNGFSYNQIDTRAFAIITVQVKDSVTKITVSPQGHGTYYSSAHNTKSFPSANSVKMKVDNLIMDYGVYLTLYKGW